MKWKFIFCVLVLLCTCSCGARYFAEETSVKLYRPDGSEFGEVFSNKGYDQFACEVIVKQDGSQHFKWTAAKVNSDTVANTALEANKELSKTITNLTGTALGVVTGIPVK